MEAGPSRIVAVEDGSEDAAALSQERKKILVLGGRKSGKTSAIRTVFARLNPKDTIWLEMTTKVNKLEFDSVLPLEIWDTPGDFDPMSDPGRLDLLPWTSFSSIVYLIDIQQDTYNAPVARLVSLLVTAFAHNPALNFEIFAHKTDGLSAEYQDEYFAELTNRIVDELNAVDVADFFSSSSDPVLAPLAHLSPDDSDAFLDDLSAQVRYFTTSVHDASVFKAWSEVVQRLMEGVYGAIEGLLNTFVNTSSIDKSFLFDVNARIYVAMDINSVDSQTFKLCSEWLSRMLSFQALYDKLPLERRKARGELPSASQGDEEEDDDGDNDEAEWPVQVTRLSGNSTIAFWQFTDLRSDTYQSQEGMIEYNVTLLRRGILQILEAVGRS